jgi:hypothetical protein
MNFIPLLSTIVTFGFTVSVFRRYRMRGGTHLLLWSIGLLFYGLGTLSEVILSLTFSPAILKLWYLTGAMLTAAWLGQGTVYLLVRRGRVASILTAVLAAVSALAALLIILAPVTSAAGGYDTGQPVSAQYDEMLVRSGPIVLMTILLNIYGSVTLIGGAIYSAYLFWRKRVLANRLYGNILIAAGALSPALGGTFIRLGLADWLYVSELVGAVLMYSGFILATSEAPEKVAEPRPVTPGDA